MTFILCRRCLSRLRQVGTAAGVSLTPTLLRLPRRCLKPTPRPPKPMLGEREPPKWFLRRLANLPEAPLSPMPLPPSSTSAPLQLAVRLTGAVALGSFLCLSTLERRRRHSDVDDQGRRRLLPFDFGYVERGDEGLLHWLRRASLCVGLSCVALLLGNLFRMRRLSPAVLSALCRHTLDRPGRSALLTSPWLSALCLFHGIDFLFVGIALLLFSAVDFGFTPEEKILVFFTGAWAGSAARCAFQMLLSTPAVFHHWQGAHAGLSALAGLMLLSIGGEAVRVHQLAAGDAPSNQGGVPGNEGNDAASTTMPPRSMRRFLMEQPPWLYGAFLAGWAAIDAALLIVPPLVLTYRYRRLRLPLPVAPPQTATTVPPALQHLSSLAGLATACGIYYWLDWRHRSNGSRLISVPATAGAPTAKDDL